MSPQPGKEIHLTEVEVQIMRVIAQFGRTTSDKQAANILETLKRKLEGTYENFNSNKSNSIANSDSHSSK